VVKVPPVPLFSPKDEAPPERKTAGAGLRMGGDIGAGLEAEVAGGGCDADSRLEPGESRLRERAEPVRLVSRRAGAARG
jgi:hypothetical protein